jgi:hypothetical protein
MVVAIGCVVGAAIVVHAFIAPLASPPALAAVLLLCVAAGAATAIWLPAPNLDDPYVTLKMERASGNAIRWAIGSVDGPRGSMWRLWGNKKGDFYLSARTMGGILKTSFHKDGNCHSGFTSEYAAKAGIKKRHMDRWTVVDEPPFRVLQVLMPASDLRTFDVGRLPDHARWLAVPPADHLAVVTIFVSSKPPSNVETLAPPPSEPIGVLATPHRFCWAVYASSPITDAVQGHLDEARKALAGIPSASQAPKEPGIRGLVVAGNGPERTIWELAWDHATRP